MLTNKYGFFTPEFTVHRRNSIFITEEFCSSLKSHSEMLKHNVCDIGNQELY